jgi:hypothetical protein
MKLYTKKHKTIQKFTKNITKKTVKNTKKPSGCTDASPHFYDF